MQKQYNSTFLSVLGLSIVLFFVTPYVVAISWENNAELIKYFDYLTFYWMMTLAGMLYRPIYIIIVFGMLGYIAFGFYEVYIKKVEFISRLKLTLIILFMPTIAAVPLILYRIGIIPYVGP